MPFPMKIQPIDSNTLKGSLRNDPTKPVAKSRFKRLFERQFPSVLRISSVEKPAFGEPQCNKDANGDFEPSSVCLAKMVQNFIEESNEKQKVASKCGRNRCNCFNGNCNDSSDDEFDVFGGFCDSITATSSSEPFEVIKSLVSCASVAERNLLADTAKIMDMNKICRLKDDCRKIVMESLSSMGYDASICKSRWEKTLSYPAGEYEYVDVIIGHERLLIDIDFRSEFEIARSTKNYRAVLQALPSIFVGKPDRLQQIVSMVSEAAKQSLKKEGMHFPPWRKAEYMRAKWLSPYTRTTTTTPTRERTSIEPTETETEMKNNSIPIANDNFSGEFELIFGEKSTPTSHTGTDSGDSAPLPLENSQEEEKIKVVSPWQPPAIKPKSHLRGAKIVTGLTSVLNENP